MGRYRGQLFHWDVLNENPHYNFFESMLGPNTGFVFYLKANRNDPRTTPYLNEYNIIEESRDGASSPTKYLQAIRELRKHGYNGPLGIGVQGHFFTPNLPYMLASARLPIWVTELDVRSSPNQAAYLDQILRELHSDAAVQGIMIWSARSPQGCYAMCLTDNNFRNLATGDVVDRLRNAFVVAESSNGTTDSNGFFETSLFHGEYDAKITHPNGDSHLKTISLTPSETTSVFQFKIDVMNS